MTQDELYMTKCRRAGRELLHMRDKFPFVQMIVYGSLARGVLGMGSDIDIMLVFDTDAETISQLRKEYQRSVPHHFEDEFPYVDVRFARLDVYNAPDNSEYGAYIKNCREDGITIWKS